MEFRRSHPPTTMASADEFPSPSSQKPTIQLPSEEEDERKSSFAARSHSSFTPRTSPSPSPRAFRSSQQRHGLLQWSKSKRGTVTKRRSWSWSRSLAIWIGVLSFFIIMNWWMFSRLQDSGARRKPKISNGTAAKAAPSDVLQVLSFSTRFIKDGASATQLLPIFELL